jgi:nicotinate-nucleotide adenylyltransferase
MATVADRLTMCQLVAEIDPFFRASGIELRRPEPSFTIDTARTLRNEGWPEVHWLIGADVVPTLPRWHEADRLTDEVGFVVMARPGWDFNWDTLPPAFARLRQNVVYAPLVEISATQLRQRVRAEWSIEFLTPPPVVEHIKRRGLYAAGR